MTNIRDEHFSQLATIAGSLERQYPAPAETWDDSPFKWMRTRPPTTKGAIIETLVDKWFSVNKLKVQRSNDREADRTVEGIRVEIKGSILWANGSFKFQQIRDQNYDLVICLGISPHNAYCWVIPKSGIMPLWEVGVIKTQHGGQGGRDTAWFPVNPQNPPDWLTPHGGNLADALNIVREFVRQQ